jgi:uncharacterized protein YprB with RNaseH-like and TPR domain
VVERRTPADDRHGAAEVRDVAVALEHGAEQAPLLGGAAPGRRLLFFDLETTGLNGGAGTWAFLVGCGWFDRDGAFCTRQHLLVNPGAERSMLEAVAAALAPFGAIVSFNGKSFDAPLLEMRYLFHRLDFPCAARAHVDVLHPARRFWGGRAGGVGDAAGVGCSLIELEQRVLGARRIGDVPGCEIPARYFQFVRSGDARPLAAVIEHNRLDLLSLAALTARLLRLLADGPDSTGDAREALALGQLYARGGLAGRAKEALRRAARLGGLAGDGAGTKAEALRALAVSHRRSREFDDAAVCWREVLNVAGCPPELVREARRALAVHHEHRVRDLAAARSFALDILGQGHAAWNEAVRHRLARIERKLASGRPRFPFPS